MWASLIMVSLAASLSTCLPAPQAASTTPAPQAADYGDDYGDYDQESKATPQSSDGLGDILALGASLAEGLMAILANKVAFLSRLLADKELRESVHSSIGLGANLTGMLARAAVPLAQGLAAQVPVLINATHRAVAVANSPAVRQRAGEVAGAGVAAAQGVPELVGQGSRLVGSVIRAANDTAPLVLEGINEFTDQLPLIAGFASAYAEVNAEQTQKVVQTFSRSLSCNLECQDMLDPQEKVECEEKFCTELEDSDDSYDDYSI